MPELPGPKIIVVGFDYSDTGDLALETAVRIAARQGAEPHIVHVAAAIGPMLRLELPDNVVTVSTAEASEHLRHAVEDRFDRFREREGASGLDFDKAVTHVRVGAPAAEVAQLAVDLGAELVVVGTHGRQGFRRFLVGSVAEETVRISPCPVLVVRPKGEAQVVNRAAHGPPSSVQPELNV